MTDSRTRSQIVEDFILKERLSVATSETIRHVLMDCRTKKKIKLWIRYFKQGRNAYKKTKVLDFSKMTIRKRRNKK